MEREETGMVKFTMSLSEEELEDLSEGLMIVAERVGSIQISKLTVNDLVNVEHALLEFRNRVREILRKIKII